MTLRDQSGIIRSQRELIGKVPGNIRKVSDFIGNVLVKELCQGID
jgi:hypothetical protein